MLLLAIVDDDPNDSSALSALVAEYFKKNNRAYMFRVFNTSMDFIRSTENYDIVFMDIRMDQLDGLEVARIMAQNQHELGVDFRDAYGAARNQGL